LVRNGWLEQSRIQYNGADGMKRWNISNIFFIGSGNRQRVLSFEPGKVNIITGASGTGKSTLIKAIDYCLGSSQCELPVHVRRHSLAVGVKWVLGDSEIIAARPIPPVNQQTSTRMFVRSGKNLDLPSNAEQFQGATTLEAAKAFLERAFGIDDLKGSPLTESEKRRRATVRHIAPYLFVTKEVIYSESVLLHGLEEKDKAQDIVSTMPYFLGAIDAASILAEDKLRQLQRELNQGEAREEKQRKNQSELKQRATSLLFEANHLGITPEVPANASENELLDALRNVVDTRAKIGSYPNESELANLNQQRHDVLTHLDRVKRETKATEMAIREASGFQGAVKKQYEKLELSEYMQEIAQVCPLCGTPSELGRKTAGVLQAALMKIRAESVAVERVQPQLMERGRELKQQLESLNHQLREIDDRIKTWLQQSEETRKLDDISQLTTYLRGKISYFLEMNVNEPRRATRDLSVLRTEVAALKAHVDSDTKRDKLQRAEQKISQFASEAFAQLPAVAPCIDAELMFSSKKPAVKVIEKVSNAMFRMSDVGSDQNYLAIHIALSFALQRYFELVKAPVPGLLVLDQISRPYYPARGEDEDEIEVSGRAEDEDILAMRRHINFLFAETERQKGLQVLLIEHAYFADDDRYVNATRERWTRQSEGALIPLDWPLRGDD